MAAGVPLEGVCLYPIIDRFEWDNPSHWHNSGLWDLAWTADGDYRRVLNADYAEELRRSQAIMASVAQVRHYVVGEWAVALPSHVAAFGRTPQLSVLNQIVEHDAARVVAKTEQPGRLIDVRLRPGSS